MIQSRVWLYMAFAAPFCYFGIQLLGALFYPNYDFLRLAASDLGSSDSSQPLVFNLGAILGGVVTMLGAYGFWQSWRATRVLLCLAVVLTGLSSIWAGVFPLPMLEHSQNPFALLGLLPMPFLVAIVFWQHKAARVWLIVPIVLFFITLPLIAGAIPIDRAAFNGLLQRLFALATYSPIAIGAWLRLNRESLK